MHKINWLLIFTKYLVFPCSLLTSDPFLNHETTFFIISVYPWNARQTLLITELYPSSVFFKVLNLVLFMLTIDGFKGNRTRGMLQSKELYIMLIVDSLVIITSLFIWWNSQLVIAVTSYFGLLSEPRFLIIHIKPISFENHPIFNFILDSCIIGCSV